jgi:hypothetical protein
VIIVLIALLVAVGFGSKAPTDGIEHFAFVHVSRVRDCLLSCHLAREILAEVQPRWLATVRKEHLRASIWLMLVSKI